MEHPVITPAPSSRLGRHLRRTARQVSVVSVVAVALAAVLLVTAPPVPSAAGLAVSVFVLALGLCRLLAAHEADAGEQRWLRHVLGSLRADDAGDEDDDHGLLVY